MPIDSTMFENSTWWFSYGSKNQGFSTHPQDTKEQIINMECDESLCILKKSEKQTSLEWHGVVINSYLSSNNHQRIIFVLNKLAW